MDFIEFIYVYRRTDTGRAVYVGHTNDLEKRDRQHSNSTGLPIDREIQRCGRTAFTLDIVEAFLAESATEAEKKAVERENFWMDELKTFRTKGCLNFARAFVQYNSEECRKAGIAAMATAMSSAMKIACASAAAHAHKSAAMKKRYKNSEALAQHSANQKIVQNRPEVKARNSASVKLAFSRPEMKIKLHAVQTKPGMKEPQIKRAKLTSHIRWHVKRGIISPTCSLCTT